METDDLSGCSRRNDQCCGFATASTSGRAVPPPAGAPGAIVCNSTAGAVGDDSSHPKRRVRSRVSSCRAKRRIGRRPTLSLSRSPLLVMFRGAGGRRGTSRPIGDRCAARSPDQRHARVYGALRAARVSDPAGAILVFLSLSLTPDSRHSGETVALSQGSRGLTSRRETPYLLKAWPASTW